MTKHTKIQINLRKLGDRQTDITLHYLNTHLHKEMRVYTFPHYQHRNHVKISTLMQINYLNYRHFHIGLY